MDVALWCYKWDWKYRAPSKFTWIYLSQSRNCASNISNISPFSHLLLIHTWSINSEIKISYYHIRRYTTQAKLHRPDSAIRHLMMMMTICFNEATRLLERSRSRWQEEEQMSPVTSRRASEIPKKRKIIRI